MRVFLVFQHHWEGMDFCASYDNFDAAHAHAHALYKTGSMCTEVHEVSVAKRFILGETAGELGKCVWTSLDECEAV